MVLLIVCGAINGVCDAMYGVCGAINGVCVLLMVYVVLCIMYVVLHMVSLSSGLASICEGARLHGNCASLHYSQLLPGCAGGGCGLVQVPALPGTDHCGRRLSTIYNNSSTEEAEVFMT